MVNYKSRKLLRAIEDLCPLLEEVSFIGCKHEKDPSREDFVTPEEIATILSKWPKVIINVL